MLIEKGANVNATEPQWNMTALHWIVVLQPAVDVPGHEDWSEDDYLSNPRFCFCL